MSTTRRYGRIPVKLAIVNKETAGCCMGGSYHYASGPCEHNPIVSYCTEHQRVR